jgi:hypothetical protein
LCVRIRRGLRIADASGSNTMAPRIVIDEQAAPFL